MRGYDLIKNTCRFILPFLILYGFYIILNGDISPGGGFQGGVVLATCYLAIFFIKDEETIPFKEIVRLEKILFITLIGVGMIYILTNSHILPYFSNAPWRLPVSTASLILLNTIIGLKVTIGFGGIMLIFTEEGKL